MDMWGRAIQEVGARSVKMLSWGPVSLKPWWERILEWAKKWCWTLLFQNLGSWKEHVSKMFWTSTGPFLRNHNVDGRLGHRIPNPGIGLQYTFVRNSFLTLCQPEDHWSYWSCMEMVPWISGKQSLLDGIKPGVYFSEIKLQMKLEWFCFVLLWYHQEPFETKQTARF